LPEEITWYTKRLGGGWGWIGLFLVLFHFAVPFAILLSRPFKRDVTKLVWLAMWLMLMRYLDLFWSLNQIFQETITVTWRHYCSARHGGIVAWYFCRNLASMPLVPAYDAFASEVLHPRHEKT